MSVTGIIVEYNPLHNGHLFHLSELRKKTNCSQVVAIMSGNFAQRGEPAIVDKWQRTKMALNAGIDLVIELPFIYCNSSAEGFAFGAVSTLSSLGIIDNLCFGCENDNIETLKSLASVLVSEPNEYKTLLKENLKKGLSFPESRQNSLIDYIREKNTLNVSAQEIAQTLKNSNNILGIEYIKALFRLSSNITPVPIKRIVNKYNENNLTGIISSATSIRNNISDISSIQNSIPDFTYKIINESIKSGKCPIHLNNYSDIILYKIRSMSTDDISNIHEVSEGLEHRIKNCAENYTNIIQVINNIKNKRYTTTRIQRILINCLFNITKEINNKIKSPVEYIRVLGFNKNGQLLLKEINKKSNIPIITNPSNRDLKLMHYDILATDLYVLGYSNNEFKTARQDLKNPPVILT